MEKGYLLILIGAILSTTVYLPIPLPFEILDLWYRATTWGYILILIGIRYLYASKKELDTARLFTYGAFIISFALSWLPGLIGNRIQLTTLLVVLRLFFFLGIFFWLFKAEYMWAPHANKRLDWLLYSIAALVYLGIFLIPMLANIFGTTDFGLILTYFFMVTTIHSPALPPIAQAFMLINLLYNTILFYILIKLYLNARNNNTPRFKRWG